METNKIFIGKFLCQIDRENESITEIGNPENFIRFDDLDLLLGDPSREVYFYKGYFHPETGYFQKASEQDKQVRYQQLPTDFSGQDIHNIPLNPQEFSIPANYLTRGYDIDSLEARVANKIFPAYHNFKLVNRDNLKQAHKNKPIIKTKKRPKL